MNKNIVVVIAILILGAMTGSYYVNEKPNSAEENGDYSITNIKIYKDTPVWELALAIKNEKTETIKKIVKNKPNLLNYQEPKYGATLLLWSVGMEKYKSVEALLECGADPNIATTQYGETPLFLASGYSWIDTKAKKDAKYVKLLLRFGADPNKNYIGSDVPGEKTVIEPGTSPLMNSIPCGLNKTKALVEAGADINYKTKSGKTAASHAIVVEAPEYAHYLIVQKKAKITDPLYRRETYGNEDPNEKFYSVTDLRYWIFDLDSKEYNLKMEIVDEFARQGINYWDAEIPDDILDWIKDLYPDTWREYVKRY